MFNLEFQFQQKQKDHFAVENQCDALKLIV